MAQEDDKKSRPFKKLVSVKDVLKRFDSDKDKYISQEFQSYGVYLAQSLDDEKHKSLYIKMAKEYPRAILDQALRFVSDSNARSKARLFMWKLKELKSREKK